MKASALIVLVLTLATSISARPPIDSDEYVDNNVVDSIPAAEHEVHNYSEEDERAEYVEM